MHRLDRRRKVYARGYRAAMGGGLKVNPFKLRGAWAGWEQGYSAGSHVRFLLDKAVLAERAFAEHDRERCAGCARLWPVCREAMRLMGESVKAFAALPPNATRDFVAWQHVYYGDQILAASSDPVTFNPRG